MTNRSDRRRRPKTTATAAGCAQLFRRRRRTFRHTGPGVFYGHYIMYALSLAIPAVILRKSAPCTAYTRVNAKGLGPTTCRSSNGRTHGTCVYTCKRSLAAIYRQRGLWTRRRRVYIINNVVAPRSPPPANRRRGAATNHSSSAPCRRCLR